MTHQLRQRHPLNACGANPLTVTLRYRCECAGNEVLSIAAVIDQNATEDQFLWTMRRLWEDVNFEVEQHLNPPVRGEAVKFEHTEVSGGYSFPSSEMPPWFGGENPGMK